MDNLYLNDFDSLDLSILKNKISEYGSFDLSIDYLKNETIDFNPLFIKKYNSLVKEAIDGISKNGRLSFDGLKDLKSHINKLSVGQILNVYEIIDVKEHFINVKRIKKSLLKQNYKEIKDYIDGLYFSDALIDLIDITIEQNGKIKLNASKKYFELNEDLNKNIENINAKANELLNNYSDSLQDKLIYVRDNRTCFLVINRDKHRFGGYIHGQSASGNSSYVEPKQLVELNNKKIELLAEIEIEKNRILKSLTNKIRNHFEYITYNFDSLIKLDVIFAKADYGFRNFAITANFSNDHQLLLKDVAHPLIDKDSIITNTYRMFEDCHILIISGSNTGGKTVALKTIALSALMSYLAIPIIAKEVIIPFYDKILFSIDDNQSITKSLSSFSASLVKINEIINKTTSNTLVLIDELGSGTDPKEGEAFAISVVDYLSKIDASIIVTTHFSGLKDFALSNSKMMLAGVGFDLEKLLPTYKYNENDYGHSNSFKIAGRYLENKSIIDKAIVIYNDNQSEYEILFRELENTRALLRDEEIKIENERKELAKLKTIYEDKLNDLNLKKNNIINDFKDKYDAILEDAKKELNNLKKEINHKNNIDINKKINELKLEENIDEKKIIDDNFNVNDAVRLSITSQVGKIIEIHNQKVVIVIDGKKIKTNIDKIEKIADAKNIKPKKKIHKERNYKVSRPNPVNVIGLNSVDAINQVSLYIDKLLLARVKTGHIIHGFGQGILRKNIHNYLKNNKYIKEYRSADINNGGYGATDIFLK